MELNLKKLSELNRLLGVIEGAACCVDGVACGVIGDAVGAIDDLLKGCEGDDLTERMEVSVSAAD